MHKCFKLLLCITISFFITTILIINRSSNDASNYLQDGEHYSTKIIPNIIHYIIFGKQILDYASYLSIVSCVKFQRPKFVYIHSNQLNFTGYYWNKILEINRTNSIIINKYLALPTHVYGQPLSSIYHATDIARIQILKQFGGIYLDTDVLVLKNLNYFRYYEMVVGWPKNEYIGTQILLAMKNAPFLTAWLEGYKRYIPTMWYYNAGQYPTEQILKKKPHLAYRVPELFGVRNLLDELYKSTNWTEWRNYYAVHLLSRHPPAPKYLNETLLFEKNNTFQDIARYILFT